MRFSVHTDTTAPSVQESDIKSVKTLAPAVYVAQLTADDDDAKLYVYKTTDRPLYEPADTPILEREFYNLRLLRGASNIVRLVAAVVSPNPYRTWTPDAAEQDDEPRVLRGLLLEYHAAGSLKDILSAPRSEPQPTMPSSSSRPSADTGRASSPHRCRRWAHQVALGVRSLHRAGLTHLDLKPQNVVISDAGDAVLIDLSGMAVTQEYLAPEVQDVFEPRELDFRLRVLNDCWALGKVVRFLADHVMRFHHGDDDEAELDVLTRTAERLLRDDPQTRICIDEAISLLAA
ncbi:kinase-like domain-containing protein [Coniochaeta sp. 2T2.1]|nr:kinase-like domain-containing protein [Coniochaeta sp. 2T2.1]